MTLLKSIKTLATGTKAAAPEPADYFDMLIVGAGISGIGLACHIQQQCPGKSYVLLENQETFGGTWHTHKYPGTRSDSDLYTFGYRFKPWKGQPIAGRQAILDYLQETIDEHDLAPHIRYRHTIKTARWSSDAKLWTLEVDRGDTGERVILKGKYLLMCQGYYRHSEGYTPNWPGMERFQGQIVHPQTWPEDLDYKGKRVLVIGSGATAATIIPAMADDCEHVTMLQRSPTYFAPGENRNELADTLRELDIPEEWVHEIVRKKILHDQKEITRRSFEEPDSLRKELMDGARLFLGEEFDVDTHFNPSYRPWRQRLAFVPDGDLFKGIRQGKVSVVTDHIVTFTEKGVLVESGEDIEADIIVTATGFNMNVLGDIAFTVDGAPVDMAKSVTYRGFMYTGLPNLIWVFGYLRTSWTMRVDLIADFFCRLVNHMDEKGVDMVVPQLRPEEHNMPTLPFIDPENFNAGYIMRKIEVMPKQGDHEPWTFSQDYYSEKDELPAADLEDGSLVYK